MAHYDDPFEFDNLDELWHEVQGLKPGQRREVRHRTQGTQGVINDFRKDCRFKDFKASTACYRRLSQVDDVRRFTISRSVAEGNSSIRTKRGARTWAVAFGLIVITGFGLLVWPTMYRYERLGAYPVRIHRVTGQVEGLTFSGWNGGNVSAEAVPLPPKAIQNLDGQAYFSGNELVCTLYNGTDYRIHEVVVNVRVTDPDAHMIPTPPAGFELVVLDRDYRLKNLYFTDPLETGLFRDYVGFAPTPNQKWTWRIKSAKGAPQ